MKKFVFIFGLMVCPSFAQASGFDWDISGYNRSYYGVMETKKKPAGHNNNLPNRWVNRSDVKGKLEYDFDNEYKFTIHNRSALVFKEHDTNYRNGEWRFYNYGTLDTPYGQLTAGDAFNVAHQFHKGSKDVGPLGAGDSSLTYFLSNPNWSGGKHSTHFYTPKSTAMMNDGRALKINYITPKFYNTLAGFTYTPNGKHRRGMISRYVDYENKDAYVFAIHNELETSFGDLYTSAGYGIFNRYDKELSLGMTLTNGNLSYAIGYKNAYVDGKKNPIATTAVNSRLKAFHDNYRESEAWDASIGYEIGPIKTSLVYLHTEAKNTKHKNDMFLFSNVYDASKWAEIYLIGGYMNAKGFDKTVISGKNRGYVVSTGLGLKF